MLGDRDDPLRNTRTTHASWLERLFIAPNRVNYHLEHHLLMTVPYFRLPRLHRLLREADLGDEDFAAAKTVLLQKLEILLRGAHKHGNRMLIDEFEPIRQAWLPVATLAVSC